jgi:hypothetical protein
MVLAHGTPAGKVKGSDRRTAKIEDHADFILAAIEQQSDSTLAELREMLARRKRQRRHAVAFLYPTRDYAQKKRCS